MEESPELKTVALRIYEALTEGDHSFFERHVARHAGMLAIGTDPNEWWAGAATFTGVLKTQLQEMGGFPLVAHDPQAYSEGSVGWMADHPTIRLPDGTEIPIRLTLVFVKENNDWKVVLWHASVGVRNEELLGKALTT